MPEGIVQFFLEEKGYGYIRVPETREEFYVNNSALSFPLKKGDRVSFDIKENQHGAFAFNIQRLDFQ